jgi:hypothetical protein
MGALPFGISDQTCICISDLSHQKQTVTQCIYQYRTMPTLKLYMAAFRKVLTVEERFMTNRFRTLC